LFHTPGGKEHDQKAHAGGGGGEDDVGEDDVDAAYIAEDMVINPTGYTTGELRKAMKGLKATLAKETSPGKARRMKSVLSELEDTILARDDSRGSAVTYREPLGVLGNKVNSRYRGRA
jgi:hypothetical protein